MILRVYRSGSPKGSRQGSGRRSSARLDNLYVQKSGVASGCLSLVTPTPSSEIKVSGGLLRLYPLVSP